MQQLNGIDYERLDRIASMHGLSYSTLCIRAEKGTLPNLDHLEDERYVDYKGAAKIICVAEQSIYRDLTDSRRERVLDYWGIRWVSKSLNNPKSKRGCGVLFFREDLEEVMRLRHELGLNTVIALRIFQAKVLGKL